MTQSSPMADSITLAGNDRGWIISGSESDWVFWKPKSEIARPARQSGTITPSQLMALHKLAVDRSDTPEHLRGCELAYRLLVAEGLSRYTVMQIMRKTRKDVVYSAIQWSRHTDVAKQGETTLSGLRRAFKRYRENTILRELKESA